MCSPVASHFLLVAHDQCSRSLVSRMICAVSPAGQCGYSIASPCCVLPRDSRRRSLWRGAHRRGHDFARLPGARTECNVPAGDEAWPSRSQPRHSTEPPRLRPQLRKPAGGRRPLQAPASIEAQALPHRRRWHDADSAGSAVGTGTPRSLASAPAGGRGRHSGSCSSWRPTSTTRTPVRYPGHRPAQDSQSEQQRHAGQPPRVPMAACLDAHHGPAGA